MIFGSYRDGELPNSEEARRYVAEIIRQVKPSLIITHWRESMHKDHAYTHAIVSDTVLLASQLVSSYEFVRGGISSFHYTEYYTALATMRGAEAQRGQAETFDIDPLGKRRVLDEVP